MLMVWRARNSMVLDGFSVFLSSTCFRGFQFYGRIGDVIRETLWDILYYTAVR